jgi:hypothetical protein
MVKEHLKLLNMFIMVLLFKDKNMDKVKSNGNQDSPIKDSLLMIK